MVTQALEMGLVILLEAEVRLSISKGRKYLKEEAEPGSCQWFQCRTSSTGHKLGHRRFLLSIRKHPCAVKVVEPCTGPRGVVGCSPWGFPHPPGLGAGHSAGCPCWGSE